MRAERAVTKVGKHNMGSEHKERQGAAFISLVCAVVSSASKLIWPYEAKLPSGYLSRTQKTAIGSSHTLLTQQRAILGNNTNREGSIGSERRLRVSS